MAFAQRNKIRPEGSMSSMTDLVFLLLIFFIILSTKVVNGEEVNLPETGGVAGEHVGVTLTITKDLRFQVNGNQVIYEDLEKRLEAEFLDVPLDRCQVTLNVDQDVPTGTTIEVLGMAREHQWGVTVATKPKKK